jgi:Family of unknown function (DUF6159)
MNPQEHIITTPSAPAMKIGKFKASFMLVQESWNILKQSKDIAWFPVLSAISSVVALILCLAIFFFAVLHGEVQTFQNSQKEDMKNFMYIGMFLYYLIMFFITNYFLAGLYTVVHGKFNGQNLSLQDGIASANKHADKIFLWSLISATVGVVLQFISDKSKLVGKIVAGLFGAVWGILTYFSLPSLIIGQKSVKESFTESASLIRKTWGEALIVNFGMGLFFGLLFFGYIALSIGVIILVPMIEVIILVGVLFVVFMIVTTIVSATLQAIFKLALYEYAVTGKVPEGFTKELIEGAVRGR